MDNVTLLGTCPEAQDVKINGAEASWTVACSSGNVYVDGWVEDTKADGRCAEVYALVNGQWFYSQRACPKGNVRTFSFDGGAGNSAQVWLRTVPA